MANALKPEVLKAFKNLHRARLTVFRGDERVLKDCRDKINTEFKKNKTITDVSSLQDMVSYANSIASELRSCVVQAEEKSPGVFALHIRPETTKFDNMPFDPNAEIPKRRRGKEQQTPCCQEDRATNKLQSLKCQIQQEQFQPKMAKHAKLLFCIITTKINNR